MEMNEGPSLVRLSSFDRMMNKCGKGSDHNQEVEEHLQAAIVLQSWWLKRLRERKLHQSLLCMKEEAKVVLNTLDHCFRPPKPTFDMCTQLLSESPFVTALGSLLSSLYVSIVGFKDPSLKIKNVMARNPRTIASVVMISCHPQEVLLDDTDQLDDSQQAHQCLVSARLLLLRTSYFLRVLIAASRPANTSNMTMASTRDHSPRLLRQGLAGYRHALRWFLECLEAWKDLDRARLVRSLDAPYAECYSLCVSLRETENSLSLSIASLDHDNSNNTIVADTDTGMNHQQQGDNGGGNGGGGDLLSVRAMLSQAEQRCERMREAMRQLVRQSTGPTTKPASSAAKRLPTPPTSTTSLSQPQPQSSSSSSSHHQSNSELLQLQSRWEEIHAQIHAAHAAAKASLTSSTAAQSTITTHAAGAGAAASAPLSSLLPAMPFSSPLPLPLHPHLLVLLHGPSPAAVNVPANHLLAVRRTLDRLTALGALPPAPSNDGWPEPSSVVSEAGVPLFEPLFALGDPRHQLLHALLVDPNHRLPPARSPSSVTLGWYEGQGLGSEGSDKRGGGLPWLRMVQTLARGIHTPHTIAGSGNGGSSGSGEGVGEGVGGNGGGNGVSPYEAVAARLAGALVLTMQDSLVWSLTLPAATPTTTTTLPAATTTAMSEEDDEGRKDEGKEDEGKEQVEVLLLRQGDVVPVICHVGSESRQQQMVLSAKVLSIETMTTATATATATVNNNSTTTYYTVQFLCDHSIERICATDDRIVTLARGTRAKLAGASAEPLIRALRGCIAQVQGLLGSGSGSAAQGLREDLVSLLDEPLVRQMVERDALGGGDLRPMLDRLMDVLAVLLAPVRLEAFRRWRDSFTTLAFPTNTPTTSIVTVPAENTALSGSTNTTSTGSLIGPATTTTAAVSGPLSSKRSLVALVPLLGPFCEFVALTVEEVKRDMANFYLSSLVASPQAPWRVYGAAVLARHVNHAAAVCLLQRQQQQQHMSEDGDNGDDLVSSSSSTPSAMAHGGASRLPLDTTLSLVASLLAPPPPSPPSPSSASTSSHTSPVGVDVGGAGTGRWVTERDLSDALNTPFLVASLAVATTTDTTTTSHNNSNNNDNDGTPHNPSDIALALAPAPLPPPSPPVLSLTLPMRQLLALLLVRVWQFPVRLDTAAAATAAAITMQTPSSSSSSSSSLSLSMLTMMPEPLSFFEGKRLAEVRDLVDLVSVQCAMLVALRQTTLTHNHNHATGGVRVLATEAQETALLARLGTLLSDPHVDLASLQAEGRRFVREVTGARPPSRLLPTTTIAAALGSGGGIEGNDGSSVGNGGNSGSTVGNVNGHGSVGDWESKLDEAIKAGLAASSPVLALFTKRIYKVILKALLGQPFLPLLPSLSLQTPGLQPSLMAAVHRAVRAYKLQLSVYSDVYALVMHSEVVQQMVKEV